MNIDACDLGSEGLGAVVDALPDGVRRCATTLDVFCTDNGVVSAHDDTFVRERVLPAVRASRRLTMLLLADDDTDAAALPAVREVHGLVYLCDVVLCKAPALVYRPPMHRSLVGEFIGQ